MESKHPVGEAIVVAFALGIFFLYHVWFFGLKTGFTRTSDTRYYGINGKGKLARVIFTHAVTANGKAAILGVQQSRNAMMGATFQATVASLFFNVLLSILLNPKKMIALHRFSKLDPLLKDPPTVFVESDASEVYLGLVNGLTILIINIAVILGAILLMSVCVRLYIHAGYFYRAASHDAGLLSVEDALTLTMQSQVVYTLGQRLIFFFPISVMWLLGPTALLCTSVVVTSGVAFLDRWDPRGPEEHVGKVLACTPKDQHSAAFSPMPAPQGVVTQAAGTAAGVAGGSCATEVNGSTSALPLPVSEAALPFSSDPVRSRQSQPSGADVDHGFVGTHAYSARRRDAI